MPLLKEMGLFRDYDTLGKRIRKLQRKEEVHWLGKFEIARNQKLQIVFSTCQREIKSDTVRSHEIPLSRLLAKYYPYCESMARLYDVDPILLPDATLEMAGATYQVEFYTGKQTAKQVGERFTKYAGRDETILFVCRTKAQIQTILSVAEPVQDTLALAVLEEVLKEPFGKVWQATNGLKLAVPKGVLHPVHKHLR